MRNEEQQKYSDSRSKFFGKHWSLCRLHAARNVFLWLWINTSSGQARRRERKLFLHNIFGHELSFQNQHQEDCSFCLFVYSLGACHLAPQQTHTKEIYSYLWIPGLSLTYFYPTFLNLNYSICLLPLGFYFTLFCIPFLHYYSTTGCVAGNWTLVSFSSPFLAPSCSLRSQDFSPIYFLCLAALLILSPA